MTNHIFRGSRKHILDIVNDPNTYETTMRQLLPVEVKVSSSDIFAPSGYANPQEKEIPAFCLDLAHKTHSYHTKQWAKDTGDMKRWWLASPRGRAQLPVWDLLSTCTINDAPGLLLVEAKAHEDELPFGGKPLKPNPSPGSIDNHRQISGCISQAGLEMTNAMTACGLRGLMTLSSGSHYQLCNRVTWAWKLTEYNIPVALLYLGFIGDTYFPDDYFTDCAHWQRTMGGYMQGVIPQRLPGHPVSNPNGETLRYYIKCLEVQPTPAAGDDAGDDDSLAEDME